MSIDKYISKHLSAPKGIGGNVVSFFMNRQNHPMYDETSGAAFSYICKKPPNKEA